MKILPIGDMPERGYNSVTIQKIKRTYPHDKYGLTETVVIDGKDLTLPKGYSGGQAREQTFITVKGLYKKGDYVLTLWTAPYTILPISILDSVPDFPKEYSRVEGLAVGNYILHDYNSMIHPTAIKLVWDEQIERVNKMKKYSSMKIK